MTNFTFYIIYILFWSISILPYFVLYFFSDLMYYILYYVIRYRKETVAKNLERILPLLSKKERIVVIQKKYYRHLCDTFFEIIKTMTISEEEKKKHLKFTNIEVYKGLEKSEKSIIITCSHYADYEGVSSFKKHMKKEYELYGITKKIKNIYINRLISKIRKKFGGLSVPVKETISVISRNNKINKKSSYFSFVINHQRKAILIIGLILWELRHPYRFETFRFILFPHQTWKLLNILLSREYVVYFAL